MNNPTHAKFTLLPPEEVGDPNLFQQLLEQETVPVPEFLKPNPPVFSDVNLSVERYSARWFHELEAEKLWPKAWQMVCREEDIQKPGDHLVYDIVNTSIIVMRGQDGAIRGFYNSCLHRGRALRMGGGAVSQLKCPYHGFTWDLQGEFKSMPTTWDFKHLEPCQLKLPQVQVDTWGGFVFINQDIEAPPLLEHLGVLPEHFKDYSLDRSVSIAHVQRRMACNWKVAQEAFMESMHTRATHPQIMTFTGDVDSQYDIYGDNISRSITPMAVTSSNLKNVDEALVLHDILEESGRMADSDSSKHVLPEGMTTREYIGELNRGIYAEASGVDLTHATHAELLDAILYSVFPNTQVWAGYFGNIVYRAIPDGDNHEACLFDVWLLGRYQAGSACPPGATLNRLPDDQEFCNAKELGALGAVFDQDMNNLDAMTKGLKTSKKGAVSLASYQESRIRHHHLTLDKYLGLAK
ncbi:aromatic ring-hydroxylating oxygenase subunit alpha [Pseudomonas fluorescens]|uniref:3-phenylpropionate/cinnamic acid dioxygenase subunit alpha n=1 Tax=Pseudomonas fluorescens TaxID=294 RepID=A0A5E7DTZ0_PSEFL|nr:aromatic ring-hydroxylating dioxygenase subunit alpha [Pseudomonas fluorescens]VVO21099.1 3-phenylpropionate/cinnamic acid dioxygenase subunit alpha [Pseudomonas fluorescens]